ncbi:MAG: type IV pilin [Methanocorpusculum sp.]|nr:type IV pilin [Methanocorpusculum sp.]
MKADVILKKKEDAVSPVIGVMLMLVVTIVIAAVVAAFAGGIATDTEPTPSVVLSADAYEDKVMIQSLSGDRLEIDKLSVNIYKEVIVKA